MTLDALRTLCLALPGATEAMPFGPDALVFKVRGKMFALTNLERLPRTVALKGAPEDNLDLRERYGVAGAFHMNKRHWTDVPLRGAVPDGVLRELVGASHALVVAGLPQRERDALEAESASG